MRGHRYGSHLKKALMSAIALAALAACSSGGGSGGGDSSTKPITSYCPYLPSRTFSSGVTVNGKAYFEYRLNGNGAVSDSKHTVTASAAAGYAMTINGGTPLTYTCTVACTAAQGASAMASLINATSSAPVTATYTSGASFSIAPKTEGVAVALTALSNLSDSGHADPAPIRYAEVRVSDSSGKVVQCAETTSSGTFSFQLPSSGATYTVQVVARANNAHNTAYIMNNPTDNEYYSISTTVTASGSPTPLLLAKATTSDIQSGPFNILDQIYKAQEYLRTATADCDSAPSANYYQDCDPFPGHPSNANSTSSSYAPIVYVYWSPGLTPAVYEGATGPISYYLNGKQELYILGGVDGDIDVADMDQFDNSVIIHEYGHFIEDQFGKPDSPGGSHNGNAIVDPRLAWGEGWANFFQAAVQSMFGGSAIYRDTYGHLGCTGTNSSGGPCTGVTFNVNIDLDGATCDPNTDTSCIDQPTASGEGNFREFSVSRILWDVIKSNTTADFSELWTAFHGTSNGMKAVNDKFKSIGRLHKIQQSITNHTDWSTFRTAELQAGDMSGYGSVGNTSGCATTSATMGSIKISASEDMFRNDRFYTYYHSGGAFQMDLSWSGGSTAQIDLDLYIYKEDYVFGDNTYIPAFSEDTNPGTSGTESISTTLSAGWYMVNVRAYTGSASFPSGTQSVNYNLTVNGSPFCLHP